jgi:hypothetical protein
MTPAVTKRRSLTPLAGMPPVAPGTHAMRRGDVRKEMTERVTFRGLNGRVLEGWALNASRGGLRAILEGHGNDGGGPVGVELGDEFDVLVGDPETAQPKKGRIVWMQDEPDGVVVGIEFAGLSGAYPAIASASSIPPPPVDAAAGSPGTAPMTLHESAINADVKKV